MDREDKRILRNNVIKFIIGIILLSISYSYIQAHPAEKVSIISGFEVMFQRVNVFFHTTFDNNGDTLKRKYSLEKYYQELIRVAENNKCVSHEVIVQINTTYMQLKKEPLHNLESSLSNYVQFAYEMDSRLRESCDE